MKPTPKLTGAALRALQDPVDFLRTYGDYFCSELIYGAELIIFTMVTTETWSQKQDVAAELKVAWQSGRAEAELDAAFSKATEKLSRSYRMYAAGTLGPPQSEKIPELLDYARKYFENPEHLQNLVRARYSPFTKLAIEDRALLKNLDKYLDDPWSNRDKLLRRYAEYKNIVDKLDVRVYFYLPGDYVKPIRSEIQSHIDAIKDEWQDKKESPHELRPPEAFLSGPIPEKYEKKLDNVQTSDLWGGFGGSFDSDDKDNLGVITAMAITWTTDHGGVITWIRWWKRMKDGKELLKHHGRGEQDHQTGAKFELTKGEYINRIRVRADKYVRQVTFWTNREKQYGPYPEKVLDPAGWPHAKEFEMENVVVHGFQGRGGSFVDAFGVFYTPVAEPEADK